MRILRCTIEHKLKDVHLLRDGYTFLPVQHLIHMVHSPSKLMTLVGFDQAQEYENGFTG